MYIRKIKNKTGTTYYHLVESYREGKKVRQRTLLSLGKTGDGTLDKLLKATARYQDAVSVAELAKDISVDKTFILGPLLILEKLFEELGINHIIEKISDLHPRLKIDIRKAIFTIIAGRFVHPSSKLKVYEHWQKSFYPEMLAGDLSLQHIYRTLDVVSKHKEDIEKSLFHHGRNLFNYKVDIILYDLTTLRFESTRTDLGDLRQFGYSKEMRTDCTQVILGLLVDQEGVPLGFEVYPGNTFEGNTLNDIVDKMTKKFNVKRFIFVADRGIFSKSNLDKLTKEGVEFIVGMKLGTLAKEEVYDLDNFEWIQRDELATKEIQKGGHRNIVTWSKIRSDRDKKKRSQLLEKIEKKLSGKKAKTKNLISNKGYKKYVKFPEDKDVMPIIDKKAIEKAEKQDGFFGIATNIKGMSSKDIIMYYKSLWQVEDAFGEIKGTLKTRPIFHWTDARIIGHLTLCFISYLCESHLTKRFRENRTMLASSAITEKTIKPRPLTVPEALKELREVRAVPVKIRGKTVWTRTDIAGNVAKLFRAAKISIPPKLLKYSPKM